MTKNSIGANMMLISSVWKNEDTIRLIPVTKDCPFVEAIYDKQFEALALVSTIKKTNLHMVEKLDDNGDVMTLKMGKRENGKPYKEERKALETFQEHYIVKADEIEAFIKMFAVNASTFDYKSLMTKQEEPSIMEVAKPEIIMAK